MLGLENNDCGRQSEYETKVRFTQSQQNTPPVEDDLFGEFVEDSGPSKVQNTRKTCDSEEDEDFSDFVEAPKNHSKVYQLTIDDFSNFTEVRPQQQRGNQIFKSYCQTLDDFGNFQENCRPSPACLGVSAHSSQVTYTTQPSASSSNERQSAFSGGIFDF